MPEEKKNMPTVDDQYQRLIAARNFHYENLNKWLITFYAIIGALFLAFYTLYSKDAKMEVEMVVAIVGYIVSIAALLSIKGYFYWEYNWIEKLYRFEKNVMSLKGDEQVYSSIINKEKHDIPCCPIKSANVSTTKVSLFVTFCVAVAWGFIVSMLCFKMNFSVGTILISLGVAILTTFFLMFIGAWCFNSELGGLDELPDNADTHKSSYSKAVCITIVVLVAIATFFVTMGYIEGKEDSNSEEKTTISTDSITATSQAQEPIKLEITVKQNAVAQSHQDVWFGIIGSLLGAIVGAFLGWWLTTLSDKCKENKRKEKYVKEIQLLTEAILTHTKECNNAISIYCDNIEKRPFEVFHLNKGIIASIERLSRLDATLVYEAFEYKGKAEQFYKFLNSIDQLMTLYVGAYENYDTNNKDATSFIKEFEEIQIDIDQYLRDPLLNQDYKTLYTNYLNAKKENHNPNNIHFVYRELVEPTYRACAVGLIIDQSLQNKSEKAISLYKAVCNLQICFTYIMRGHLSDIQKTIKHIDEIKL